MDKKAKHEAKRRWQAQERAKARAALPLAPGQLAELFELLSSELADAGSDGTNKFTLAWLEKNNHPTDQIVSWLENNGGFCDCEILMNAGPSFEDAIQPLQRPLQPFGGNDVQL